MTLRDLCEPLFLHVCRLNRSARKGATSDYRQARSEIEAILADMRSAALSTPGLSEQFERIEVALIFFVDSMIAESQLPFAAEWHENRLAYDRHERAGDEKFFDILEETLVDKSQAATERLGVLYTGLGLGFTGWYAGQHTHLRRKMSEAASRLRREMDPDEAAKICPQAYEHTDTRVLTEPPGAKLLGIAIALAGLVLIVLAVNFHLYGKATDNLETALDQLKDVQSAVKSEVSDQ